MDCSGALIAPDIFLTAAGCADHTGETIIIGAYGRNQNGVIRGDHYRTCVEWVQHPDYFDYYKNANPSTLWNVALCKLDTPVEVDQSAVRLVIDRDGDTPYIGEELVSTGLQWTGSEYPDLLQRGNVTGVECPPVYAYVYDQGEYKELPQLGNYLCAAGPDGNGSNCPGEIGAPLMKVVPQPDGPDDHVLLGIVTFRSICYSDRVSGDTLFTRIDLVESWIDEAMCQLNSTAAVNCDETEPPAEVIECEEDQSELVVSVMTDPYAYENDWVLSKLDGALAEWIEVERNPLDIGRFLYEDKVCLEADTLYKWSLNDVKGDGVCSSSLYHPGNSCGRYDLTLDGQVIYSADGRFDYEDSKEFGTFAETGAPSMSPTECTNGEFLNITVITNGYYFQNEWTVEIYDEVEQEWSQTHVSDLNEANARFEDILPCLQTDRRYRWTLTDTAGDGLRTFYGDALEDPGYFSVVLNGVGIVQDQDFDFEVGREFQTGPVECIDEPGFWYFFHRDKELARQCKSLQDRIDRQGPAVGPVSCALPLTNAGTIADVCKETCATFGFGPCA